MLPKYLYDRWYMFYEGISASIVLSIDLHVHCVSMELNHVPVFISRAVCDCKCVTQDVFAKQH